MDIFYKQGALFKINMNALSPKAKHTDIINNLYASVYQEFKGAVDNKTYSEMSPKQRFEQLNLYANNWLKQRGLD